MRRFAPFAALAVTLVLVPRAARACCGTQVVLVRDGLRVVVSIENAMIVPVPPTVQKGDVKVLDRAIFDRVDALDAPRMVEYWEQDPCAPAAPADEIAAAAVASQLDVGDDEISIVPASALPDGAQAQLRPYVDRGWKFLVAKADPTKALPPLRVEYASADFALPVHAQDLIIHVLSTDGRVQAANEPNAFIPTNLDVTSDVRAAIFERAHAANPKAIVTEYAWDAPALSPSDLQMLGADVTKSFTLTRLHARDLGDELVFAKAVPVVGGREIREADGALAQDAQKSTANAFQARYAIRHPWTGPITCSNPRRGVWGARTEPAPVVAKGSAANAPELPPPPPLPSSGCGCHSSDPGPLLILLILRRKR